MPNVLSDDKVCVEFDSAAGGKIRSISSRATGHEYLYQDRRPAFSDHSYSTHDISGIDECFPTVAACESAVSPSRAGAFGDHGILWRVPWTTRTDARRVICVASPQDTGLSFKRVCMLGAPGCIELAYSISNKGSEPYEFLYAHHALLAVDTDTRVRFPIDMEAVYPTVAENINGMSLKTWTTWPCDPSLGINDPYNPERRSLLKCFSNRLRNGAFNVSQESGREVLEVEFDAAHLPYLGILVAQGYGPTGQDGEGIILGIEPTSGIGDELLECRRTGSHQVIGPGGTCRFWIRYRLVTPEDSA